MYPNKIMSAVVMALIALLMVVQPLLAAAPVQPVAQETQHYGLSCEDGVCRVQLELGVGADWLPQGAWLSVMQSALRQVPGGAGFEVSDDVTITLPTGNLSLADADLTVTLDEAGKVATLRGSASAPVPTFGLLGDWQVVTPGRVEVGFDLGATLDGFNAPLQPDRRYFFIDAEAGLHLATQHLSLTSDAGQRATLLVDFTQPLVYVDGHITLYTDGQMAFLREALGPVDESGWLPAELPLQQKISLHLQGQVGRDVEPQLTLSGEYRMDGGLAGKWLKIDATPLLAQGKAMISPQGVIVEGTARSTLQPERWFDSGAQAQLFVPFDAPETASLTVGADVASPALGVEQAASATVAGEPGWLAQSGQAAWAGVQQGWNQAGAAVQTGSGWVAGGMQDGWEYTQSQWCRWTSTCAEPVANSQDATKVAAAE